MKRREITEYMKQGKLYVKYYNKDCLVLHPFNHSTWIKFGNRLWTVRHKKLEFSKLEEGEPTYIHEKMYPSDKKNTNKEFLNEMIQVYKDRYNLVHIFK